MIAIFDSSNTVKIEKVTRIKEGEKHFKYLWNVDGVQSKNWLGFDTIDECLDDCLTHLIIKSL